MGEDKHYYYSSINIYLVDDEESVDGEDFETLGFWSFGVKWALTYRIFVYTTSMVKGYTSAKHTFTSFYAVSTRIWTSAHMGYNAVNTRYVRRG